MVRRFVALVVLVALVAGGAALVSAIFGGDDSEQLQPAAPSIHTVINDGVTPTTLTPTTTTEIPIKPLSAPTVKDPAEVLIMGDSDAGGFGPYLQQTLNKTGIATTTVHYKQSSGLARPDYFDWPSHMHDLVQRENPDIVVVTFGGNDAQGLRNSDLTWAVPHAPGSGVDDTTWKAEYAQRVGATMDYLAKGNRTLIWVGIPNDNDPAVTARLKVQDEVVRTEAAKRPRKVVYIDTWTMFAAQNGGWTYLVVDPRDGKTKAVRRSDGFHLNDTGCQILAVSISAAVKQDLRDRGATI
jgi:hypothetical protein